MTMTKQPSPYRGDAKWLSAKRPHVAVADLDDDNEVTTSLHGAPSGSTGEGFELLISCARGVSVIPMQPDREYIAGRDEQSHVYVQDSTVSRQHARFSLTDVVTIRDLGSSNGTFVGGVRLRPHEAVPLPPGVVVELGRATLVVQRARPRDVASTASATTARPRAMTVTPGSHIVADPTMHNLYGMLDVVAPSEIGVLVLGETGVGKEVFACEVHRRSRRAGAAFVAINCAALPESILESELFGHEKGAFTGAAQTKIGLFEAANGGTVFLDEIGDMPLSTQAKVLRVLESGEILRLGSVRPRKVDVRFVAATNRDLAAMIEEGKFRADLYFRINGMTFTLPPLRRRRMDIAPLASTFLAMAAARHGRQVPSLSTEAVEYLERLPWPGNVRELRNVIERAVVLCGGATLTPEHFIQMKTRAEGATFEDDDEDEGTLKMSTSGLRAAMARSASDGGAPPTTFEMPARGPSAGSGQGLAGELKTLERERILDALARCAGNQSQAAKALGMSRTTLIARIREYNVARPRQAPLMADGMPFTRER